jgi:hypothetical protein
MFALSDQFDADRFESVLLRGTQFGLAKSMETAETLLADLARVTTPTATVVLDCYDPTDERASDLLGYRTDAASGLAFRVMSFEYDGTVGETLLFRLFSPERLREAAAQTAWTVDAVKRSPERSYYVAALRKE